jgi:hypothetical protein
MIYSGPTLREGLSSALNAKVKSQWNKEKGTAE